MRERAHLAGGWLTAGPDGEHFRVTVFIPFGAQITMPGDGHAGTDAGASITASEDGDAQPVLAAGGLTGRTDFDGEADHRG